MASEKLSPSSTLSNLNWTAVGAATVHQAIDEGVDTHNGDTDRITATVIGANVFVELSNPASGPHDPTETYTLRFMARRGVATGTAPTAQARIYTGAGATFVTGAPVQLTGGTTWTLYEIVLTQAEAAQLGDLTDVQINFLLIVLPEAGDSYQVTAAELDIVANEAPDEDQVLVPDGTVSFTDWTASPVPGGGAGALHENLDEGCDAPDGDTTRIFSTVDVVGAVCRLSLTSPNGSPTSDQDHTVRLQARRQGTAESGEPTLNVRLFSGATQVVAFQLTLSATWTVYERPLTPAEIALISDYAALDVQATVNTLPTAGQSIRISALDLLIEAEDVPPPAPTTMVPDSTVSNSNWTASGAATIHECTDEGVDAPNDATDFIRSSVLLAQVRMTLSNPASPGSPAVKHFARVRARRIGSGTSGEPTLNVRMLSAGTPFLAYQQVLTGGDVWTTYERELTTTELALISDYDAAEVILIIDQLPSSGGGQGMDVSAVDLFISDESTEPPSAESIVPDETVSNTGWTAQGATTLHECTDDGFVAPNPNDDVDKMTADTVGATCRLGFTAPLGTPSAASVHTLRMRARRHGTAENGEPTINVRMIAGSTQFLAVQFQMTGGGTWTTYEHTLTAAQIAAIGADYSDIDGIVVLDALPTAGASVRVSALELNLPDAPRTPTEADRLFPDATVAATGWTTVGAAAAHLALDDNPEDHDGDATYATASAVGSLLTLGLSDPSSVPDPSLLRVLRVVARREGTDLAGEPAILLKLFTDSGATEIIAFDVTMAAGAAYAVYQTILTGAQTALLPADFVDLRATVELTANPTAGASVRVTAVDLAFVDSIPGAYVVASGGADLDYSEGSAPGYETRLNVFVPTVAVTELKPILITFFCSGLKTTDRRYVLTGTTGDGIEKLMLDEGWPHIECSVLHALSKAAPGSSTPIPGGGRFKDCRTQEWIDYWSPFRCVARAIQYVRKLCESGGLLAGIGDPDQIYVTGRSGGGHMAMAAYGMREFAGTPGMDTRSSKAQGGVINSVAFPWWPIALQSNWQSLAAYFDGPGGIETAAATMNEVPDDVQSLASFLRYAFDDSIGNMPGDTSEGFAGNRTKTLQGALYLRATEPDESIAYDNGETEGAYTGNHAKNQLTTWPHSIWNSRNIAIELRQAGGNVNAAGEAVARGFTRVSTEASKFDASYDSVSIESGDFSETDPVVLDQRDFLLAQEAAALLADETVEERIMVDIVDTLAAVVEGDGYYHTIRHAYRTGDPLPEVAELPSVRVIPLGTDTDTEGRTLQDATTNNLRVMIIGGVHGGTGVSTRLQRLKADIHKALQEDRTRGGNAIWTATANSAVEEPVDDSSDDGVVFLEVVVHFRTKPHDLTVAV